MLFERWGRERLCAQVRWILCPINFFDTQRLELCLLFTYEMVGDINVFLLRMMLRVLAPLLASLIVFPDDSGLRARR